MTCSALTPKFVSAGELGWNPSKTRRRVQDSLASLAVTIVDRAMADAQVGQGQRRLAMWCAAMFEVLQKNVDELSGQVRRLSGAPAGGGHATSATSGAHGPGSDNALGHLVTLFGGVLAAAG